MSIIVRSNEPKTTTEPTEVKAESLSAVADESGVAQSAPAEKSAEQKEMSESETDTETKEGDETDSEELETSAETDKDDSKDDKPKKKSGFQRRIDKLNAAKAAAQQEMEYWKQQALKGASESKKDPVETKPAVSVEGKPDPNKFDTHAEYVEALTDWKTEQKFKEQAMKQERDRLQSEQAKVVNTYSERVKDFEKAHPDFKEVTSEVDGIPLSMAVRDIILSSDNGPELAYELAKDPEEYERVCSLPTLAAAREMGKLEARIASKASPKASEETKKITKAPKPLETVGTGGKGTAPKSIYDPSLSQIEYERLRKEQNKPRRQI